ncbi:hypothetical protein DPMN_062608 [Dreissena polymorpha]|uniref:Uncharacterized protein n=1 Tax=Dreissena polymorpha TaxID=45954 RepID=A0A9D4C9R7_DREPO|nr:hypothetical protein DPMN_062608 [Dreissena polymorpha]
MNNKWPHGGNVFQQTGTSFELVQDIIGTNLLSKFHENPTINVASTVLTRQILMTHNGRQTIDKSTVSFANARNCPTPWRPCFLPPIWTIFELSQKTAPPPGGHVFLPIWTIFELVRDINKTTVLTKFHDEWANIVTSRVNTSPPPGGHVFPGTGTIFELNQIIIKTNILTKLHEDWALNVTSTVFTSFKLSRGINGTNVLTKFHEDRTINVASGMFKRQMLTAHDARRTKGDQKSSP